MPFVSKSVFEKHKQQFRHDDDLHVQAISNPEEAAHIAALKLVMNTHLREKMELTDIENKTRNEYLKTIINQKNHAAIDRILKNHLEQIHAQAHISHFVLGR